MGATVLAVANRAGVSASTVSRVFGNPAMVAEATRRRVQEAALALGYSPQQPGSPPRRPRTHNVGLVLPDLENPHFAMLAKHLQARMRELGYRVFLSDSDEDPALEVDLVSALAPEVDCAIVCSARASDEALHRYAELAPLVLVDRRLDPLPAIVSDESGGARDIVRHLAALGHRSIAFAGGPAVSWTGRERLRGLQLAASELGVEPIVVLGSFQPMATGGVAAADLFLATGATALVTHNDLMGLGALNRLLDRGVRVPEEASIASFDDILPATLARPALTSAGASPRSVARAACALAQQVVAHPTNGTAGKHHRTIAMNLLVRGSTGPVRTRPSASGNLPAG